MKKGILEIFEKSKEGYLALEDYLNYGTVDENYVIVDPNSIANYHNKHEEKEGRVHRWLPMYGSVEDEDDNIMSVGVTTDINDLLVEMESLYSADEFDIVLILDGSGSMVSVWENLPKMIDEMLTTIVSSNFVNGLGNSMTPRIKIFYFRGCQEVIDVLNNSWISNHDDLQREYNKISGFSPRSTCCSHPKTPPTRTTPVHTIMSRCMAR